MGTRNLTCVVVDGEYKVAQYGQWDGYPGGQGVTALGFLRSNDLDVFKSKVQAARFLSDDEARALEGDPNWQATHGQLSRNHGAKILSIIANAEPGIILGDHLNFAADGLMCEYAYVVDFDKGTFEVFEGFNKSPLAEGERFASLPSPERSGGYTPVKHLHTFDLSALPTEEEFLVICEPRDEDEDEDE